MRIEGNGFTIVAAMRGLELPDPDRRLRLPAQPTPPTQPALSALPALPAPPAPSDVPVDLSIDVALDGPDGLQGPDLLELLDEQAPRPCQACGVLVAAAWIARTGRALHGCCQPPDDDVTRSPA